MKEYREQLKKIENSADRLSENQRRRKMKEERRLKRQRNPYRGLFWGLLLILLGVLFFIEERGWLVETEWWEALVIGLGAILIIESFIFFRNPVTRSYTVGRLIPGAIILFIGLAFLFGFNSWWPLALVGTGSALFFSSWVVQKEIERRRITQETLQQSEIKYQHIIDNANSIIMEVDPHGNIIFMNKFALGFFGYQEKEILGRNVLGTVIPPTDIPGKAAQDLLTDIVSHPEKYLHNERESVLRNGEKVWIVWTSKPIFDEDGNLKEILCIGINRTEEKKAEALIAEQLKEKAALEERNRLARDLHDAVSQTLFSASLIAEVLPRLWERNIGEGKKRLEEIRQLTRGALAEMRTLLLELRPASLKDADLGELLRQLAESINGRVRIPVKVEVNGGYELPPAVKIAFYRIAQEALNNIAKHSGATTASVVLDYQPQCLQLSIADNGRGFEVENIRAQSLGVGIMRERAREISARLEINSQVNQGTRIAVSWERSGEPVIARMV
ncbi:MAG: histidine kinase [Dehalococcoidales bacterium]|nr:histidine kinase [Dehalococcoidales bacterium]